MKTKSLIGASRPYLAGPCLPRNPRLVSHSGSLLWSWTALPSPHTEPVILSLSLECSASLSHLVPSFSAQFISTYSSDLWWAVCYRNGRNNSSFPIWVSPELGVSPIKRYNLLPLTPHLGRPLWQPWEHTVIETTPQYSIWLAFSRDADA